MRKSKLIFLAQAAFLIVSQAQYVGAHSSVEVDSDYCEPEVSLAKVSISLQPLKNISDSVKSQVSQKPKLLVDIVNESAAEEIRQFYSQPEFPKHVSQQIKVIQNEEAISDGDLKEIFPPRCDKLIGQVSDVVRDSVTDKLLEGPQDIVHSCPGWTSLNTDDRKDFYVALVTAMAMAESSCNNAARAQSVNGTAFGLWQTTRPLSPTQGASWVMKQLNRQVSRSGLLFWPNSNRNYWAVLNPRLHAGKVQRLLKMIPACAANAATQAFAAPKVTQKKHKHRRYYSRKTKKPLDRVAFQRS